MKNLVKTTAAYNSIEFTDNWITDMELLKNYVNPVFLQELNEIIEKQKQEMFLSIRDFILIKDLKRSVIMGNLNANLHNIEKVNSVLNRSCK